MSEYALFTSESVSEGHPDKVARLEQGLIPIFDGRNLFEPARIARKGFTYYSVGR